MKGKRVSTAEIKETGTLMLKVLKKCGFHRNAVEILENDLSVLAQSWSLHNKFRKGAGLICPVITPAYSSLPDSIERLSFRARGYSRGSLAQFNCRPETAISISQAASALPHWMINMPDPSYTMGKHPLNAEGLIARREAPHGTLKTSPQGTNNFGFLNLEELMFYTAFYGTLGRYSYCAKAGRLAGAHESSPMLILNAAGQVDIRNENPTSIKNVVYPFCFSRGMGMNT